MCFIDEDKLEELLLLQDGNEEAVVNKLKPRGRTDNVVVYANAVLLHSELGTDANVSWQVGVCTRRYLRQRRYLMNSSEREREERKVRGGRQKAGVNWPLFFFNAKEL